MFAIFVTDIYLTVDVVIGFFTARSYDSTVYAVVV